MAVGALVVVGAVAGGQGARALEIKTLVGNYVTSSTAGGETLGAGANAANSTTLAQRAIDHGNEVAHLIAELRTFTEVGTEWDDILSDYDEDIKKWTESNPLLPAYESNEWTRITTQQLRGTASALAAASSTPIRDYIEEAVNFAKTDVNKHPAMREIIEKTIWDAVSYQGGLMFLSYAQNPTDGVCMTPAGTDANPSQSTGTKAAWDVGAAMLIGDGYHSVLGRAQKRGDEFDTLGAAGISKAYENIMKLLRDGQEEKDCAELHEIYERIESQMRVVYLQSILKYAYKIDKALASGGSVPAFDDIVAEGQAMYRVIAGDIKAKPAAAAATTFFDDFFDITTPKAAGSWAYGNYCEAIDKAKLYITAALASHGVSYSDLGTYKDAANVDCTSRTVTSTKISTLVGNYKLKSASTTALAGSTAHDLVQDALNHGDVVAHFIAELRTFTKTTDDWDDIDADYDADVKKWAEDNTLLASNEWTRITTVPIRNIAGVALTANPLKDYIAEAVAIAKTDSTKLEAMREIIEKTVWDAVGYQGALRFLSHAQKEGDGGACVTPAPGVANPSQSAGTKAAWDVGAAMIIGDGYHSVLGRAQKRGVEFGTVGAAGVSKAYENIMKLLRDGQEEKTCNGDGNEDLHEIYERIEAQMRIVYSQSILKYAYKIDKEILSKNSPSLDTVAEGQAMYRVIAGDIKNKAATAAAFFDGFFDINNLPTRNSWDFGNYCAALTHVKTFVTAISSHGVSHSDLGTYEGAAHVNCDLKTNDDPDHEIATLSGSYYPSYLAYSRVDGAADTYEAALALSRNVAHVAAEMDSWIQNQDISAATWSDITEDFTSDYKKWTESSTAQSNEWTSMVAYEFTNIAVGSQAGSKSASATPLSDYLNAAVTLATSDVKYLESAKEMIEKTMLDAVGFHGAINLLSRAQDDASSPPHCVNGQRSAQQRADWDTAAALIIGDGYHSVLGRAQKRGVEFGTMGTAHTAATYEKIVKYLRYGQEEKNCDKLHEIYEGIEKQLRIVYAQCVVKYAYKIDAAIKAGTISTYGDDQSEGQALYRVIAGDVKRKGADTAFANAYQFFDALFDVRATPSRGSWDFANYCKAIDNMKGVFGISDAELGHYHESYHVHCESKMVFDSSSYAALVHEVYSTHATGVSKTETRTAEALAAFSFIIAVAGVVVGSIALHKVRKTGATAFKNSYVVHNI